MSVCPGCGLEMPDRPGATMRSYYHASPECWSVYTWAQWAFARDAIVTIGVSSRA